MINLKMLDDYLKTTAKPIEPVIEFTWPVTGWRFEEEVDYWYTPQYEYPWTLFFNDVLVATGKLAPKTFSRYIIILPAGQHMTQTIDAVVKAWRYRHVEHEYRMAHDLYYAADYEEGIQYEE